MFKYDTPRFPAGARKKLIFKAQLGEIGPNEMHGVSRFWFEDQKGTVTALSKHKIHVKKITRKFKYKITTPDNPGAYTLVIDLPFGQYQQKVIIQEKVNGQS